MKTDSELKQDVEHELKWEPSVNEAHIGVSVHDGIVTLSGHVPSYGEKHAAEKAAKRVYGVRAVADQLDVKLPGSAVRTDEDIAASCINALHLNSSVPDEKIKVVVSDGQVTLEGDVEWQFQREAALNAVRFLIGVKSVKNNITLRSRVAPKDIKDRIVTAFHRSADIDARRIEVEVRGHKVVLRGHVRSWAEKDEAKKAAWAAPGVTEVEDDLIVTP